MTDPQPQSFIGAYDGSTRLLFYSGVAEGWVTEDRFVSIHGVTPEIYCVLNHRFLSAQAGTRIVRADGTFPNPFPGRRTFLGFLPDGSPDSLRLGHAVHVNLGSGGPLVNVTQESPGVREGRYQDFYATAVTPHSDPVMEPPREGEFLVYSRPLTFGVFEVPNPDLRDGLETFIGAFDNGKHYYAGVGRDRGWVKKARFEAIFGKTPIEYCATYYVGVLSSAGHLSWISRNHIPDPAPGVPTYLGIMPVDPSGHLGLAVHLNAGKFRSNTPIPNGFAVHDATRSSPGARANAAARFVNTCGPPPDGNFPDLVVIMMSYAEL